MIAIKQSGLRAAIQSHLAALPGMIGTNRELPPQRGAKEI
jgi:hypothetical protein